MLKRKLPRAHPGTIVLETCIKPLGLTVTEAAAGLGVTRKTLSAILNGRAGISADMARRLAQAFGSTPDTWLRLQVNYDLEQACRRAPKLKVRNFTAEAA